MKNIIGQTFGYLKVVKLSYSKKRTACGSGGYEYIYECKCLCGTIILRSGRFLKSKGIENNCGCNRKNKNVTSSKFIPEYRAWTDMRYRCSNKNHKNWKDYGGRGIKVCRRWSSFTLFLSDMGKRPSKNYSIDRVNNNGNYSPNNCRWATRKEQHLNRRSTRWVELNGVKMSLSEASKKLNIRPNLLRYHLGISLDKPGKRRIVRFSDVKLLTKMS